MTPTRFAIAMLIFHALVGTAAWIAVLAWRDPDRCRSPLRRWGPGVAGDAVALAVFTYLSALLATTVANLGFTLSRIHVGPISLRLLGQALFLEGVLVTLAVASRHRAAQRQARAAALAAAGLALLAVNVDAYYIEPARLEVRHYAVGAVGSRTVRILHISDLQTPTIGAHEARALVEGLRHRPDLIVLTGDYVQDAMGRSTEARAAADLRALMARIGFAAPLGVFATEGDVGPACADVFRGTDVRCLVDSSAIVTLDGGGTLGITGLSRGRGRERRPENLARILAAAPPADHRIVISHSPDFVAAMPLRVDLVLAGHTHGGQVVIPFFGPPKTAIRLPRRYAGGLNDYRGTPVHVSRGVGMERGFEIPVRFLCPPEVSILDLALD